MTLKASEAQLAKWQKNLSGGIVGSTLTDHQQTLPRTKKGRELPEQYYTSIQEALTEPCSPPQRQKSGFRRKSKAEIVAFTMQRGTVTHTYHRVDDWRIQSRCGRERFWPVGLGDVSQGRECDCEYCLLAEREGYEYG